MKKFNFIWIILALPMSSLLCSCGNKLGNAQLNASALYDPPMVHLTKGTIYHFTEGDLTGTGQVFYSNAAYQRAFYGLGGVPQGTTK